MHNAYNALYTKFTRLTQHYFYALLFIITGRERPYWNTLFLLSELTSWSPFAYRTPQEWHPAERVASLLAEREVLPASEPSRLPLSASSLRSLPPSWRDESVWLPLSHRGSDMSGQLLPDSLPYRQVLLIVPENNSTKCRYRSTESGRHFLPWRFPERSAPVP